MNWNEFCRGFSSMLSLAQLFKLIQAAEIPDEFMAERDNNAGEFRDVF